MGRGGQTPERAKSPYRVKASAPVRQKEQPREHQPPAAVSVADPSSRIINYADFVAANEAGHCWLLVDGCAGSVHICCRGLPPDLT